MVGRLGAGRSRDLRRAVLLGSAVPLLLCVVWSGVSSLLTLPAMGAAAGEPLRSNPALQHTCLQAEVTTVRGATATAGGDYGCSRRSYGCRLM